MKEELELKLVKAFPLIYKDYKGDASKTCMAFGLTVEDGWFDIIWELSSKLELLIQQIEPQSQYKYCAAQVKEKFGSLRFYMLTTPEMSTLIREAQEKASHTCEICGELGEIQEDRYGLVRCNLHIKD